jgi:hypothetical protein
LSRDGTSGYLASSGRTKVYLLLQVERLARGILAVLMPSYQLSALNVLVEMLMQLRIAYYGSITVLLLIGLNHIV